MPAMKKKTRAIPGHRTVDEAAAEAGMSRRTLYRWLQKLKIEPAPNASYLSDEDMARLQQAQQNPD